MIIEDIKRHLEKNCPLLSGRKLNINCLGEKSGSLIVKTIPCEEVIREYADGASLKQYVFEICLRTSLDTDVIQNTETAVFMEKLKNWFCSKDALHNMDFFAEKAFPVEFDVLKTHGVSHLDRSGAQHTLRARLIYEQN